MKNLCFPTFVVLFPLIFAFLTFSVSAKDVWIQARSKNFNLVGNASERDIRKVATKLEQFRETFRQLFSKMNLNSPIPTNVVVFKSDGAYKPFKPVRADGKADKFIAGYFQPGEDVNYITLSTEGDDADTYGTIFHEYVHFMINTNFGKSEVPPWFNEGLAEYYQTFAIEDDQKVKLGLPQSEHLFLLQQNSLIPLETLFKISNYALHQNGNHSRSIFYAESWALIHYLIQGGKADSLGKFLNLVLKNVEPEKAFQEAFQTTYAQMEKDLKKYVEKRSYQYSLVTFKNKLVFNNEMQVLPLSEADSSAYLGDLLYHTNRADDAETYLQKSLALNADSEMANTTYGMVKLRQRKYEDAKKYLEKAIAFDGKNHLSLYRYAYLLSREDLDEFGYIASFPAEKASKMRELLKKAIALNPTFTESYELLAFVDIVQNEELDEAISYLRKALAYQPGNQRYELRIAEIYLRQDKLAESSTLAGKIAQTADEPEIKQQAENLSKQIAQKQEFNERQKQYNASVARNGSQPILRRSSDAKTPSPEEVAKAAEKAELRSINQILRKPRAGEKQIIGRLEKIECKGKSIAYKVKTEAETFTLTSVDFQTLELNAYTADAEGKQVGCDANLAAINSVLTYKPRADVKNLNRGELVAIEFVPNNFRFLNADELDDEAAVVYSDAESTPMTSENMDEQQRAAIMRGIKSAMRVPQPDEKRELGFIEKIECGSKGIAFYLKSPAKTYKLTASSPQAIQIRAYTPEAAQIPLGCGLRQVDIPVVFTFKESADSKNSNGDLTALEFVPKNFALEK